VAVRGRGSAAWPSYSRASCHSRDRRVRSLRLRVIVGSEDVAAQHELQAVADLVHGRLNVDVVRTAVASFGCLVGDDVDDSRLGVLPDELCLDRGTQQRTGDRNREQHPEPVLGWVDVMSADAAAHVRGAHADVDGQLALSRDAVEQVYARPLRGMLPSRAIDSIDLERVERVDAGHSRHTRRDARDEKISHRPNLPHSIRGAAATPATSALRAQSGETTSSPYVDPSRQRFERLRLQLAATVTKTNSVYDRNATTRACAGSVWRC
jgi:hypothetical protein